MRDAPLSFLVHGIQNSLAHVVNLPMHMRLAKDGIDQRGLAMVNVGDDGDIPDIRPVPGADGGLVGREQKRCVIPWRS